MERYDFQKKYDIYEERAIDCLNSVADIWKGHEGTYDYYSLTWTAILAEVPSSLLKEIDALRSQISELAALTIDAFGTAPLASAADQAQIRLASRRIASALHLNDYQYFAAEVLHDEDRYLGMQPASQTERGTTPMGAIGIIRQSFRKIRELLPYLTIESGSTRSPVRPKGPESTNRPIRPDSAFVMMWMSDDHPELEDVKIGIVEVFREFDIEAVRADDIEHEELITERITQEIATAEFLIADLTGARPNVYYEVGFAHALGKRPILFRKKDTALHFDLAGRNVPAYANVADLKAKLRARLEAILGTKSKITSGRQEISR